MRLVKDYIEEQHITVYTEAVHEMKIWYQDLDSIKLEFIDVIFLLKQYLDNEIFYSAESRLIFLNLPQPCYLHCSSLLSNYINYYGIT